MFSGAILICGPASWLLLSIFRCCRFYNLVLLPRIRDDLSEYKKLNFHLFMALKKAIFKPASFFKGILLPICEVIKQCSPQPFDWNLRLACVCWIIEYPVEQSLLILKPQLKRSLVAGPPPSHYKLTSNLLSYTEKVANACFSCVLLLLFIINVIFSFVCFLFCW